MRQVKLKNNIFIEVKKSEKQRRKLDYYMKMPSGKREYLFTRDFSTSCYEVCKSGLPVNDILYGKKRNKSYMGLVKYLKFMMPYFVEYFGLEVEGSTMGSAMYA